MTPILIAQIVTAVLQFAGQLIPALFRTAPVTSAVPQPDGSLGLVHSAVGPVAIPPGYALVKTG